MKKEFVLQPNERVVGIKGLTFTSLEKKGIIVNPQFKIMKIEQ